MIDPATIHSTLSIASVEPFILRIPIATPVKTPMGMVDSAIALLVRVTTTQGEEGWGEVWCNFPRFSAFNRAVILTKVIGPFLKSRQFAGPYEAWSAMSTAANVLRLQSGDTGAIASAIAGVDIALWDIVGKRERRPIWSLLGGKVGIIDTYASLGRSHGGEEMIEDAMKRGFRGFKLRCWGNPDQHIGAYHKARAQIGPDMELMTDCNSSWDIAHAADWSQAFAGLNMSFIEEPIPVDSPKAVWQEIARRAPAKIAGGENMITEAMLDDAIDGDVYGVVQPDICKYGGFSGLAPIAARIVGAGKRYAPHIFSGAPGLLASAHILAAANSPDGALEYGIEYNPPRDDFVRHQIRDGKIEIGDAPGLGVEVDVDQISRYHVATPSW
ncbi:MAG: mandelate racemase/muconate lactonizing enzyme family protein [Hyphomicrobiales bacterium]|nr:mandelate racemase/muconate lactonizing enzyme family protein [Hyphomicrobiales bacterium]MDE2115170.1 mandelate racemase/muconate lactonizing enzyme family protein [Hyphomicrobiales bacterium]